VQQKQSIRNGKQEKVHQQEEQVEVVISKNNNKRGTAAAATFAAAAAATTANLKVLVRGTFCVGRSTSQSTRRYYLEHHLALR
jgi:hypothetical protein